jgi:hypothetical protein
MREILPIIIGLTFTTILTMDFSSSSSEAEVVYSYQSSCSVMAYDEIPHVEHLWRYENDKGVFFLEQMNPSLPVTINFVRMHVLGYFYSQEDCLAAMRLIDLNREITNDGSWYRAHWHKNSCDLLPQKLDSFLGKISLDLFLKLNVKACPLVRISDDFVIFSCSTKGIHLARSYESCQKALSFQKTILPRDLYQQFGWEDYE